MFKIENTLKNKRRTYFGSWSEQAVTQYKHSSISIFSFFQLRFLLASNGWYLFTLVPCTFTASCYYPIAVREWVLCVSLSGEEMIKRAIQILCLGPLLVFFYYVGYEK